MNRPYLLLGILALVAFVLSFGAGYHVGSHRPVEVVRDTVEVVRVDTIVVEKPVAVYHRIVDTMRVPVRVFDTITVRDSVFIELPREQAFYQDGTYRAWVSGYRPALDSIEVYQKTKTVTITERIVEESGRWGIGVSAGYAVSVSQERQMQFSPYIGIGVTYNFATFGKKPRKEKDKEKEKEKEKK